MMDSLTLWGVFSRLLGILFVIHFVSIIPQIRSLVGTKGIVPARDLLRAIRRDLNPVKRVLRFPTYLWLSASDFAIYLVCITGTAASLGIVTGALGRLTPLLFFLAWSCSLSIQTVGDSLFLFPWDLLLGECAFLGMFLPGLRALPSLTSLEAPDAIVAFAFNWLLFRVVFGMGLTKFRRLGPTEKDLSYIFHFYQWQPMPTAFAYYLRNLPMVFHKASFIYLFLVEVILVFGIFGSPDLRYGAGAGILLLQLGVSGVGNFGTFNLLTLALCLPLLQPLGVHRVWLQLGAGSFSLQEGLVSAILLIHILGSLPYLLLTNFWNGTLWLYNRKLIKKVRFRALFVPAISFLRFLAPFRILNSFGIFCYQDVLVRDRMIMRFQGSYDGVDWFDYEPKFLTHRENRRPPFFAPYHPRFDQYLFYGHGRLSSFKLSMFMACNPYYMHSFCFSEKLLQKLLRNDPAAVNLFRKNTFQNRPPNFIRYALFLYQFTTQEEKKVTGRWWKSKFLESSEPISRAPYSPMAGIHESYDRFITESLKPNYVSESFDIPITYVPPGATQPELMQLHPVLPGRAVETELDASGYIQPG